MNRISKLIFLMFLCFGAIGQGLTPYNCDVYIEGEKLLEPFVGGLNLPQTYAADLNNDGILDVIILDRAGNTIIPYIRTNDQLGVNLKYAPEYKSSFNNVREWMVLRDFNADGVMDIFGFPQSNQFGIEVRKGYYSNDTLRFEIVRFNEINGAPDIVPIPSSNGNYSQLYVAPSDQPEIYDVDNDGDLDVLTFDALGSYLQFWKNYTLEKGLGLDTFSFELEDPCWGKFYELETDQQLKLSDNPANCATLFTEEEEVATNRHAGSCVTVFDNDGDGDIDLLLGDLANNQMTMVINGGDSSAEAWMVDQDINFPSYDTPIDIDVFNAGFHLDVDNDGKRDLIASPNFDGTIENYSVMWHYENKGTDANPDFELQTENLFVEDMLDFGSTSSPAFVDYNEDGLMDIVVGNLGRYRRADINDSRLLYFKNQGTLDNPVFELVDDDFANYAQFQSTALTFNPCFGDLDGDGDIDMIVGDNNGYLFYSENIAGPDQEIEFAQAVYQFQNIRPGNIVHPQIADLNGDGLGDLILGERANNSDGNGKVGALIYYPNLGEVGNPVFEADEDNSPNIIALGNVNTQTIGVEIQALTAPYFYFDGEETILFTGSKNGKISLYSDIDENLDGVFTRVEERYGDLYEGEATTVAVYDIDNDNLLEMLIGNQRGGLSFYNTSIVADVTISTNNTVTESLNIEVFPNPSRGSFTFSNKKSTTYQLYSTSGVALESGRIKTEGTLDLSNYTTGVYMIHLEANGKTEWKKLVKL